MWHIIRSYARTYLHNRRPRHRTSQKNHDELIYLSQRAFTSAYVCAEPLIHQGHTRSEQEIRQGSDLHKDTQGGVMIWGLWDRQVDAIIDVNLGDADADTYKYKPMK